MAFPAVAPFQLMEEPATKELSGDPSLNAEKLNPINKSNIINNGADHRNSNSTAAATTGILYQRKAADAVESIVPLQGKFKLPRGINEAASQTQPLPFQLKEKEEEEVQLKKQDITVPFKPVQKKENKTGLPDNLKSGVENLSGFSMDDVTVHYNSDKPAQLNAFAYARGTDIHIASGQEKHLPHEAWHVVQQKQGRVQPTMQMKGGVNVNDDANLEKEAGVMGDKAFLNNEQVPDILTDKKIAGPVAAQRMKIGMELTFSNEDLQYMHFDKKEYDKKKMPNGDQWGGKLEHADYCNMILKRYHNKWAKEVLKNNENRKGVELEEQDNQQGKGAAVGLNKMFMYTFDATENDDSKTKETPVMAAETTPLKNEGEATGLDTKSTVEPGERKDITVKKKLPEEWWWDIDVDPMCLEIRAEPIDHLHLASPVMGKIIQEDIFDIALNKLKLKTGYAGQGGGHISVDFESGFDSDYMNVVKTVLYVELMQKQIDKMVQIIDVFDEKNAPYLLDHTRKIEGLGEIKNWLVNILNTPVETLEKEQPGQDTAPEKKVGRQKKVKKKSEPKVSAWDIELKKLAGILSEYHTSDQTPLQLNPPKIKTWHTPLHYQNINLQHTRSAERNILEEEDRRVEFRRLVAQRNYTELMQVISLIVGWIQEAKKTFPGSFLDVIEPKGSIGKFIRPADEVKGNQGEAEKIQKADNKGIVPGLSEIPGDTVATDKQDDIKGLNTAKESQLAIKGESGVDKIIVFSVREFIKEKKYNTAKSILVVTGKAWTCYIRCVLHHFDMIGQYGEIMSRLDKFDFSLGVEVGSDAEGLVQNTIAEVIGKKFHVEATDVAHGNVAISKNIVGEKVTVVLTGAHFSLLY